MNYNDCDFKLRNIRLLSGYYKSNPDELAVKETVIVSRETPLTSICNHSSRLGGIVSNNILKGVNVAMYFIF